jgi:hypothetical protein
VKSRQTCVHLDGFDPPELAGLRPACLVCRDQTRVRQNGGSVPDRLSRAPRSREVKVRLSPEMLVWLQSLKVMGEGSISATVERSVRAYRNLLARDRKRPGSRDGGS